MRKLRLLKTFWQMLQVCKSLSAISPPFLAKFFDWLQLSLADSELVESLYCSGGTSSSSISNSSGSTLITDSKQSTKLSFSDIAVAEKRVRINANFEWNWWAFIFLAAAPSQTATWNQISLTASYCLFASSKHDHIHVWCLHDPNRSVGRNKRKISLQGIFKHAWEKASLQWIASRNHSSGLFNIWRCIKNDVRSNFISLPMHQKLNQYFFFHRNTIGNLAFAFQIPKFLQKLLKLLGHRTILKVFSPKSHFCKSWVHFFMPSCRQAC